MDDLIRCLVIKLQSTTTSDTSITIPKNRKQTLNIKLPVVSLYVRNFLEDFKIEIEIMDSKHETRIFRLGTYTRLVKCAPTYACLPLKWSEGWNLLTINLNDFCKQIFQTDFALCKRVSIHANCHLRQIFFSDKEYEQAHLPSDLSIISKPSTNGATIEIKQKGGNTAVRSSPERSVYSKASSTLKTSNQLREIHQRQQEINNNYGGQTSTNSTSTRSMSLKPTDTVSKENSEQHTPRRSTSTANAMRKTNAAMTYRSCLKKTSIPAIDITTMSSYLPSASSTREKKSISFADQLPTYYQRRVSHSSNSGDMRYRVKQDNKFFNKYSQSGRNHAKSIDELNSDIFNLSIKDDQSKNDEYEHRLERFRKLLEDLK
ncbi:hypothetical protein GJ496_001054 [Pomphorhynchus laevis]|nr:hypothetical protein GJ496_001054 [Pomphorhynchus laevis]